ncbi:MAG: NAD(P)H-binding protein [Anaerolineales bacterium]|nr:NAD(P)H-binding protein [Anaerolineales bacterium]
MILVTGGTGFVGQALIRHLVEDGQAVRTLIRPSGRSPHLPKGVPVEAAICAISDERGLRAAMVGVDTVYHLVGAERQGTQVDLFESEVGGTRNLVNVARDAGVERIFYVSHLGADRASAYPLLKVKGIAEEHIRRSGIDHTIIRSGLVFGPRDHFTTALARMLYVLPFVFPLPGDGNTVLQPLWVEDLATILAWAVEDDETRNKTYEVGGPEYITATELVNAVMQAVGNRKRIIHVRASYLRLMGVLLEYLFPQLPFSIYWLDYLAANRTADLDTIPRDFGLMPARFSHHLGHLEGQPWERIVLRELFNRRAANA